MAEQALKRGRRRSAGRGSGRRAGRHAATASVSVSTVASRIAREAVGLTVRTAAVGYLTAIASLALWASAPAAWGWKPALVIGNSMNPAVAAGDVLVTSPTDPGVLHPGHMVLFERPGFTDGSLVTHRIESRLDDGTFITRGDANGQADSSPVHTDQIVGVARLRVPAVGRPVLWLRQGQWAPLVGWALLTIAAGTVAFRRRVRP